MHEPVLSRLLARGVVCPAPATVWVADDVKPEAIAPGVILHPGCRLSGARTSIGPGCELGAEAPVTLDNAQLGHGVKLKGGYVAGSTLWDGVDLGSAAHVRPGCLLEEESGGGHAVGLKQTLLFPFVTLGSLINFCDLLMSGGTSRHDHGEVGSSYIHFNFTPHQDKATASLLGDVPRGVMLDQHPIFLGGQGGLVGPRHLAFGTVVAAGGVCRHDVETAGILHIPSAPPPGDRPFDVRRYGPVLARVTACVRYLGHLRALQEWYRHTRPRVAGDDPWRRACAAGGLAVLDLVWAERVKRLAELVEKLPASLTLLVGDAPGTMRARQEQQQVLAAWPRLRDHLAAVATADPAADARARWLELLPAAAGAYPATVRAWPAAARAAGTAWLQAVVDSVQAGWQADRVGV